MKKTNFLYASLMMAACTFGVQSCTVDDNPAPDPTILTEVFTYDFEAIPDGTKLGNLGGSAANGQAFYAWEKADKTDSKRQDYKGYTLVDGVNLPDVCHVWVRGDRFDQDNSFKNGGLNIRNDREMAIDGLSAGSIVQITYDAPEKADQADLSDVPFQMWDGWVDANPTGTADCVYTIGTTAAGSNAYGDPSVNNYADLSGYAKLIITTTAGTPRMLFNRDVDNGQCSENEAESHLIDNTNAGCMTWAAKYFSSKAGENEGETIWTVDLAQMVKDKGYAHLHAIKNNWGAPDLIITSMKVEGYPYKDKLLWAIGDGTSSDGPGVVRAEVEIEGVNEAVITGQTEIASGAAILVKSVTPADKGTGYIVVKVKKGMTIKKVVITNFVEQMPY